MASNEDNCASGGRNSWGPPALDQDQGSVDRSESWYLPQESLYMANKRPEKQKQNDLVVGVDLSGWEPFDREPYEAMESNLLAAAAGEDDDDNDAEDIYWAILDGLDDGSYRHHAAAEE